MVRKEEKISMSISKRKIKKKGSAFLVVVIVSTAIAALASLGITKMEHYNLNTLRYYDSVSQAQHYAQERAEVLRVTPFESIRGITKTGIGNTNGADSYMEEVIVTSSSTGIYKDCRINIYMGDDETILATLLVRKVDPNALVNGTLSSSILETSDKLALTAAASAGLVDSKISEGVDSESLVSSFSAGVFKDYLNNVLANYERKDQIVKREENSAVGSNIVPVYVNADGYADKTNLYYRFLNNPNTDAIGLLVADASGNFYIDYEDKISLFESVDTK